MSENTKFIIALLIIFGVTGWAMWLSEPRAYNSDINRDGKVDLVDLSILMASLTEPTEEEKASSTAPIIIKNYE